MCEQVDDFTCSESDPELDPETVIPARGTAGHAGRLPKVRTEHCPRPSVAALSTAWILPTHKRISLPWRRLLAAVHVVCVVVGWGVGYVVGIFIVGYKPHIHE